MAFTATNLSRLSYVKRARCDNKHIFKNTLRLLLLRTDPKRVRNLLLQQREKPFTRSECLRHWHFSRAAGRVDIPYSCRHPPAVVRTLDRNIKPLGSNFNTPVTYGGTEHPIEVYRVLVPIQVFGLRICIRLVGHRMHLNNSGGFSSGVVA
jgi:hypothetical protein